LERQKKLTEDGIKRYKAQMQGKSTMSVDAAIEDTMPDRSPYEKALDVKGVKPVPYMQELPKPKGWEIVENFFNEIKREHSFIRDMKEEGKETPIKKEYLNKRLNQLDNMVGAIDTYKNMMLKIDGVDKVAFKDIMMKFEEILSIYENTIRKYTNQRNDAVERLSGLQQEMDHLKEMYDPDTGEFKGLNKEEIDNLKGIFLRLLYRDLERYWSTRVGKDLSVFGDRDTNWYDNVFRTFKNVASSRSNKKMLGLVNKYKQETMSDFDDITNRLKSQQLEKKRDALLKGYKQFDIDPVMSSRIKDLNTRIGTLKKQEEQINRIFNFMGSASATAMQADFEQMLRDKIKDLGTGQDAACLLYTSPSPRDRTRSRMPSSA